MCMDAILLFGKSGEVVDKRSGRPIKPQNLKNLKKMKMILIVFETRQDQAGLGLASDGFIRMPC